MRQDISDRTWESFSRGLLLSGKLKTLYNGRKWDGGMKESHKPKRKNYRRQ